MRDRSYTQKNRLSRDLPCAGVPRLEPTTNDSDLGCATPPQLRRISADFRGFHGVKCTRWHGRIRANSGHAARYLVRFWSRFVRGGAPSHVPHRDLQHDPQFATRVMAFHCTAARSSQQRHLRELGIARLSLDASSLLSSSPDYSPVEPGCALLSIIAQPTRLKPMPRHRRGIEGTSRDSISTHRRNPRLRRDETPRFCRAC